MKLVSLTLALLPLMCTQAWAMENASSNPSALMEGKMKTDRTVFLQATIDAPPSEVFRLWTSPEGVKKFFAPGARIDTNPGGRYQIISSQAKIRKAIRTERKARAF